MVLAWALSRTWLINLLLSIFQYPIFIYTFLKALYSALFYNHNWYFILPVSFFLIEYTSFNWRNAFHLYSLSTISLHGTAWKYPFNNYSSLPFSKVMWMNCATNRLPAPSYNSFFFTKYLHTWHQGKHLAWLTPKTNEVRGWWKVTAKGLGVSFMEDKNVV